MSIWKDPKVELPKEERDNIYVKIKGYDIILNDVSVIEGKEDFVFNVFKSSDYNDLTRNTWEGFEPIIKTKWTGYNVPIDIIQSYCYEEDLIKQAEGI